MQLNERGTEIWACTFVLCVCVDNNCAPLPLSQRSAVLRSESRVGSCSAGENSSPVAAKTLPSRGLRQLLVKCGQSLEEHQEGVSPCGALTWLQREKQQKEKQAVGTSGPKGKQKALRLTEAD